MKKPHAIVVGVGPGVGGGIAHAFASAGYNLSLLSRDPSKQTELLQQLRQTGATVETVAANAGNTIQLSSAIEEACAKLGSPDVLLYNAVALSQGTPSKIDPDGLTRDFSVNVSGALAAAQAVLPAMSMKRSGTILFTGGGWAHYPSAQFSSISIGKAGLRHLALMLNDELTGTGVRAAILTIMGMVAEGTAFAPQKIGQAFLKMARSPDEQFQPEIQFVG
jgi:NADP-dependent 3-hydroxy acid dehydrogenase YdfG